MGQSEPAVRRQWDRAGWRQDRVGRQWGGSGIDWAGAKTEWASSGPQWAAEWAGGWRAQPVARQWGGSGPQWAGAFPEWDGQKPPPHNLPYQLVAAPAQRPAEVRLGELPGSFANAWDVPPAPYQNFGIELRRVVSTRAGVLRQWGGTGAGLGWIGPAPTRVGLKKQRRRVKSILRAGDHTGWGPPPGTPLPWTPWTTFSLEAGPPTPFGPHSWDPGLTTPQGQPSRPGGTTPLGPRIMPRPILQIIIAAGERGTSLLGLHPPDRPPEPSLWTSGPSDQSPAPLAPGPPPEKAPAPMEPKIKLDRT